MDASDAQALVAANAHADTGDATTLAAANAHIDTTSTATLASANNYTHTRVGALSDDFNAFQANVSTEFQVQDRRISKIGAMGAAFSGLASNTAGLAGENRGGVGFGSLSGEQAFAIGYQHAFNNNRASVSVGGAFSNSEAASTRALDSAGKAGVRSTTAECIVVPVAGIGYSQMLGAATGLWCRQQESNP